MSPAEEPWDLRPMPIVISLSPGTHKVELVVAQSLQRDVTKTFNGWKAFPSQHDQLLVGWEQIEDDGTPCIAASSQVAVRFDTAPLGRIPEKTVTEAILTYDEKPASGCGQGLPGGGACWTSGGGQLEDKPNGCVVVRVPSTDWTATPPNGEFPYIIHPSGHPVVKRLGVREWDVTEPFLWQTQPGAMPLRPPTEPAVSRGFGFLLSGGPTINQLEAEDNTRCLSEISDIRLQVTCTIAEGHFTPPH